MIVVFTNVKGNLRYRTRIEYRKDDKFLQKLFFEGRLIKCYYGWHQFYKDTKMRNLLRNAGAMG